MGNPADRRRIGRWVVIAQLENGQTLTGQNRPRFGGARTAREASAVDGRPFQQRRRQMADDERKTEDRIIRAVLGVNVR